MISRRPVQELEDVMNVKAFQRGLSRILSTHDITLIDTNAFEELPGLNNGYSVMKGLCSLYDDTVFNIHLPLAYTELLLMMLHHHQSWGVVPSVCQEIDGFSHLTRQEGKRLIRNKIVCRFDESASHISRRLRWGKKKTHAFGDRASVATLLVSDYIEATSALERLVHLHCLHPRTEENSLREPIRLLDTYLRVAQTRGEKSLRQPFYQNGADVGLVTAALYLSRARGNHRIALISGDHDITHLLYAASYAALRLARIDRTDPVYSLARFFGGTIHLYYPDRRDGFYCPYTYARMRTFLEEADESLPQPFVKLRKVLRSGIPHQILRGLSTFYFSSSRNAAAAAAVPRKAFLN